MKETREVLNLQVFKKEIEDCEDLIEDIKEQIHKIIAKKKVEREFRLEREAAALRRLEGKTIRQIETEEQSGNLKVLIGEVYFEFGDLAERVEKVLYKNTLTHFNGNRQRTAEALGVSIRTVRNKINSWMRTDEDWIQLARLTTLEFRNAKVAQNSMRF